MNSDICEPRESEVLTITVSECRAHILVDVTAQHFDGPHESGDLAHIIEGHFAISAMSRNGPIPVLENARGDIRVRTQARSVGFPAIAQFSLDRRHGQQIAGWIRVNASPNPAAATRGWLHEGVRWEIHGCAFIEAPINRVEMAYKVDKLADQGVADAWRQCLAEEDGTSIDAAPGAP